MKQFPYYHQAYPKDCGPTCLRMIAEFYGKKFNPYLMKKFSKIHRRGTTMLVISDTAEKMGFHTASFKIGQEYLSEIGLPVILHWNQNHFVVLYEIGKGSYCIADPAKGLLKLNEAEFISHWQGGENCNLNEGILLAFSS